MASIRHPYGTDLAIKPDVERLSILGNDTLILGYNLIDFMWHDIFTTLKKSSTYVLITDTNLAKLYIYLFKERFEAVKKHVENSQEHASKIAKGCRLLTYILPPGETTKSRATKSLIEDWLFSETCTRDTMFLALGGGVIGDLVGYVAATFMRGVPYVQIPTSLLAMVDSSIGGKTAVDTPAGKNLIGAFWQPEKNYMDISFLRTLPAREFSNGMAEVIKTAAIMDDKDFDILESKVDLIREAVLGVPSDADPMQGYTLDTRTEQQKLLLRVITGSARVKAYVVTVDVRETGLRGLLNFGHSIGHAIEGIMSPQLLHGECVSIGCVLESELSRRLGHLRQVSVARLTRCLKSYGLPVSIDDPIVLNLIGSKRKEYTVENLMRVLRVDKKNVGSQKRIVLLKRLGETVEPKPSNVDDAHIEEIMSLGVKVSPVTETPTGKPEFTLTPPGSKSISNRALLLAALGKGVCRIKNLLHSDDTQVMLTALQALGACSVAWEDDGDTLVLSGNGGKIVAPGSELYMGNAGTAARFLTTLVNLAAPHPEFGDKLVVTGNHRMKVRPIGALVDALRANGCSIEYKEKEGCLPLVVLAGGFKGRKIELAATISSQYVSSILLCAPCSPNPVILELVGGQVISQLYIDMTVEMMRTFGCNVERVNETTYYIPNTGYTNPAEYVVESDASSATYPLAVAAITGTTCIIPSLGSASLQGDARFAVDVLRPMGCTVEQTATSTKVTGPPIGQLRPLPQIDMEPMTDAFLTATALAAVAQDPSGKDSWTRIVGIANQHVKECDRILAMVTELEKFGVKAENLPDGINILGVNPKDLKTPDLGGIHCYDDHRVAMSFSVLSTVTPGSVVIQDRHCTAKTWPQWWDALANDLGVTISGYDIPHGVLEGENAATAIADANTQDRSVVIIGMRGVGKTTMGQAVAKALGWEFVDLDHYIAAQLDRSVADVIKVDGWDAFRSHEANFLSKVLKENPTKRIIACGGGIVEGQVPRDALKAYINSGGVVINLHPNIDRVKEYLEADKTRPAFVGESIHQVFERRKPLYQEYSSYTLLVNGDKDDGSDIDSAFPQIENSLKRLIQFATGSLLNQVDLSKKFSSFISLTTPDIRKLGKAGLEEIITGVDAIELRVDLLLNAPEFTNIDLADDSTFEKFSHYTLGQVSALKRYSDLPVIFTVRTNDQGGIFPADKVQSRMFDLLELGIRTGCEYVDVELGWDPIRTERVSQNKGRSLIIASYHDVTGKKLKWGHTEFAAEQLAQARRYGDIAKLISVAHECIDNETCIQFAMKEHSPKKPLIALNMGYKGQSTRILCPCMTPVTHPALAAKAAKGQLSVAEILQARSLMGMLPPRQFYLFGTPIQASPSPVMHNAAFKATGLPHIYSLLESQTVEPLKDVITDPNFGGASVTIPHKQEIIPLLDELTPAGQRIGAINTIIPVRGSESDENSKFKLLGDNTDYLGIVNSIKRVLEANPTNEQPQLRRQLDVGLVIGAGGTTRAALYALHTLRVPTVYIFNRTFSKAQDLAKEFGDLFENLTAISSLDDLSQQSLWTSSKANVVIGTVPASAIEFSFPEFIFKSSSSEGASNSISIALDMAYKPRWTPLLETADRNGWATIPGVQVLIDQGVEQFKRWTKLNHPPYQIIHNAVMEKQYSTKSKKEETTSDRPKSDANSDKEKKGLFPKSGPLSLPGILLFLTTCMGMVYFYNSEKKRVNEERNKKLSESTAVGKPKLGGPFELIDHNGKEITDKDFLGKYLLVYFGFCHCPDICPDELDKIGEAIEILDKDPKTKDTITPVFITCDPQRDDPATIKQYLEGSIDQVRKACKAYRVYFSKPPNIKENQDYLVDHSIFSYLMDHNGGFVDIYGKDRTSTEMAETTYLWLVSGAQGVENAPTATATNTTSTATPTTKPKQKGREKSKGAKPPRIKYYGKLKPNDIKIPHIKTYTNNTNILPVIHLEAKLKRLGGTGVGEANQFSVFQPKASAYNNLKYNPVHRRQTVYGNTLVKEAPAVFYTGPKASNKNYQPWVTSDYYKIYPYPYWAYGKGAQKGPVYYVDEYKSGIHKCKDQLRNITLAGLTVQPIYDGLDLFGTGVNVPYEQFNNGTVSLYPCGKSSNITSNGCSHVLLDLVNGQIISGNAKIVKQNETGTFFKIYRDGKHTAVLRTQTLIRTGCKAHRPVIAGIVIGAIAGLLVCIGLLVWLPCRIAERKKRKKLMATATQSATPLYDTYRQPGAPGPANMAFSGSCASLSNNNNSEGRLNYSQQLPPQQSLTSLMPASVAGAVVPQPRSLTPNAQNRAQILSDTPTFTNPITGPGAVAAAPKLSGDSPSGSRFMLPSPIPPPVPEKDVAIPIYAQFSRQKQSANSSEESTRPKSKKKSWGFLDFSSSFANPDHQNKKTSGRESDTTTDESPPQKKENAIKKLSKLFTIAKNSHQL
ncbi:3-dehydroquinate dehydratase (3-dehydroquinase) [Mycoemilia scoparia]|uniref:Pentafunctional AROM polypeptide n=1 Tax=Mycoemilia scoparia TaxID=417184 RepID=A0A9W8DSZ4_9FUNG|nr:3-dehydroquinate dehydratase (3-dehydroquinase) [Mycoemilia scoparia]